MRVTGWADRRLSSDMVMSVRQWWWPVKWVDVGCGNEFSEFALNWSNHYITGSQAGVQLYIVERVFYFSQGKAEDDNR